MEVDWNHPVWKPVESAASGQTVSAQREYALPAEAAYQWVSGDDRRPLLVLRECELCKGSDHALLSRSLDNETTVLLTHWFHCVKMPPNVLGKDHPFRNMWDVEAGERVPHLFFADPDGGNKVGLPGDQSQSQLWDTMFDYLDRAYDGNAKRAVKEMRSLLSKFDTVDAREREIKARIDREIEKRGPGSNKLARLEEDLAKLGQERDKLLAREKEIRDLALRALETAPTEAVGGER